VNRYILFGFGRNDTQIPSENLYGAYDTLEEAQQAARDDIRDFEILDCFTAEFVWQSW
jgi:hypothetical protein